MELPKGPPSRVRSMDTFTTNRAYDTDQDMGIDLNVNSGNEHYLMSEDDMGSGDLEYHRMDSQHGFVNRLGYRISLFKSLTCRQRFVILFFKTVQVITTILPCGILMLMILDAFHMLEYVIWRPVIYIFGTGCTIMCKNWCPCCTCCCCFKFDQALHNDPTMITPGRGEKYYNKVNSRHS